eukprot:1994413-Pyramimonas_sp.AAC.1
MEGTPVQQRGRRPVQRPPAPLHAQKGEEALAPASEMATRWLRDGPNGASRQPLRAPFQESPQRALRRPQ